MQFLIMEEFPLTNQYRPTPETLVLGRNEWMSSTICTMKPELLDPKNTKTEGGKDE